MIWTKQNPYTGEGEAELEFCCRGISATWHVDVYYFNIDYSFGVIVAIVSCCNMSIVPHYVVVGFLRFKLQPIILTYYYTYHTTPCLR